MNDPFCFGPIAAEYIEFSLPTLNCYRVEARMYPPLTKAVLFHLAASGFFTAIRIMRRANEWSQLSGGYEAVIDWDQKAMAAFVSEQTWKGWQMLEKSLGSGE